MIDYIISPIYNEMPVSIYSFHTSKISIRECQLQKRICFHTLELFSTKILVKQG